MFISEVVRGGAAELDGRLMQGDQILSVDGEDTRRASQEGVAAMLKVRIRMEDEGREELPVLVLIGPEQNHEEGVITLTCSFYQAQNKTKCFHEFIHRNKTFEF